MERKDTPPLTLYPLHNYDQLKSNSHFAGRVRGCCQGHTPHLWQLFCGDAQLFPVFGPARAPRAALGDTPLARPPHRATGVPAASRTLAADAERPRPRRCPRPAGPSPIVPARLTSEDAATGPAGPLEASSRRPGKLGRWRQDPRSRTRRLRRLPSSAGARGGASPSSRESGDPGGCGCDPCDVQRSSPKAVWGRGEAETRPSRPAACADGSPRGGGASRAEGRPCPAPTAGGELSEGAASSREPAARWAANRLGIAGISAASTSC